MSKRNKIAILLAGIAIIALFVAPTGKLGRCFVQDERFLFLGDKGDTVTLEAPGPLMKRLHTGSRVLVFYSGVKETWPGQVDSYLCIPLWPGDLSDFSPDQLYDLTAIGWLTP